jgi:hypothetical protein
MHFAALNPIDSNLRRIHLACKLVTVQKLADSAPEKRSLKVEKFLDRMQELQMTLLGTMVAIQRIQGEAEVSALLIELRSQILAYRKIKDLLEKLDYLGFPDLEKMAKEIFIAFYDLEGILRKQRLRKQPSHLKRSKLIDGVAEKSQSAIALAMKLTT